MTQQKSDDLTVRVILDVTGVWRAHQVAQTLLAVDRIAGRVGITTHITETCETYDHVVRHLGTFGLLGKRLTDWQEPKSPTDAELRIDLAAFVSAMRNSGVEVNVTELGVGFRFLVGDLYDLLPISARAEVERIQMACPGDWSLLIAGAIKSLKAFHLLEKIFDSIFYRDSTKRKIVAEAREKEAQADLLEAQVRAKRAEAKKKELSVRQQAADIVLDYAVAVDSLTLALRNAGFENKQIQEVLSSPLVGDIDILSRHKSIGLIQDLKLELIENNTDANL